MKKIPYGLTLLHFQNLAPGLTEECFQKFLADRGMDVPIENVSTMSGRGFSSARISVPHEVVAALVAWAINGDQIQGRSVVPQAPRPSRKAEYAVRPMDGVERR